MITPAESPVKDRKAQAIGAALDSLHEALHRGHAPTARSRQPKGNRAGLPLHYGQPYPVPDPDPAFATFDPEYQALKARAQSLLDKYRAKP